MHAGAVKQLFDWGDKRHLGLQEIEAITVAVYRSPGDRANPSLPHHEPPHD
jgi:hypothetical protein